MRTPLFWVLALTLLGTAGCTKSPAEQCLESFRKDLVSPNSGKVFDYSDGKLTYLAKNRSGVEIQGRAICTEIDKKWMRDTAREHIEVLNLAGKSLEANNNCRKSGEPKSLCDSLHKVISIEAARYELGYN
ncbi:hypothetical protein [Xenophilus sp. Marseille-Q4582]|uniref:hypothetical protein n=1 Tax=Xenophilus sp. Marseille-Q4582 TaxID=2866600 RepID=UPI001CE4090A|nr:hypothetical protein [Xenophilus sp. Marseille-Q4582]